MKKTYLLVAIIVVIILTGFGLFYLSSKNTQHPESAMETQDSQTTADAMMGDSRYKEYSSSVLGAAASTKRVLFFYANWCPTCRPADANFKANLDKIPEGVTLIRVNYNDSDTDADESALADKYNVTYQHTFVQIDESGNPVTRWNGGAISELLTNIK